MPRPDFSHLLSDLLEDSGEERQDTAMDTRVLDATAELLGEYGERRLTMDDIANRAGVARTTLFRRFGSKDKLLSRLYQREVRRVIALVQAAARSESDAVHAIKGGFAALHDYVTSHPTIRKLARAEPDNLVGLWRDGEPSGQDFLVALLASTFEGHDAAVDRAAIDELCQSLVRLLLAEVLLPPPLTDEEGETRVQRIVERLAAVEPQPVAPAI